MYFWEPMNMNSMLQETLIFKTVNNVKKIWKNSYNFSIWVKVSQIFSDFLEQIYDFEKIKRNIVKLRKIPHLKYMTKRCYQ